MGGKETSGSANPPPHPPRPPRAPIPHPLSLDRWTNALEGRWLIWYERADYWMRTSPSVDWLYAGGVAAVVLLAAYILAFG